MTQNEKVAIFPASGGLGGSTYNHLLTRNLLSPKDVLLISRNPDKIPQKFRDAGVTTLQADYDKPETLEHAFDGVWCLNLISYASIEHEHRAKVHKRAIDAARKSGVKHIIYSSLAFGGDCKPESEAFVMQAHLDTEAYLAQITKEDESFTYTAIREGIYSESFPIYTAFFDLKSPSDVISIPHDGSGPGVAWAKQDDLGEASARLVAQYATSPKDFPHINKVVLLSGPKVWSLAETVEVVSKVTGKNISIREVPIEEYVRLPQIQSATSYGSGEAAAQMATAFEAIRRGEAAVASPLLGDILGREPEPFEETVRNMAKA